MKLGILGIDFAIARMVAAAADRGDTITVACEIAPSADPLIPSAVPRESWQALLDPRSCDVVLVGGQGWSEGRADAVRSLVQAGRTLLLSHPLVLSMLWCYELDMIRADSGACLVPFLPDRLHPYIARLRQHIESGLAGTDPLGPVEHVAMERRLADRSRDAVLGALAADVDLVRVLVGDPTQLSTLGGAAADAAWNTLAVGFSGPALVPVRWQVVRGGPPDGLRITLSHTHGTTAVDIPASPGEPGVRAAWTWSGPPAESLPFDGARVMLDLLHGPRDDGVVPPATWPDAARAVELAETVPRSLAKGRAIDLHQEEFSELGTFRGTMASLGCGLVLAALIVVVLATLVGGIAREAGWAWGERLAGGWPYLVLAVLGFFLVLQLVPILAGVQPPPSPKGSSRRRAGRE